MEPIQIGEKRRVQLPVIGQVTAKAESAPALDIDAELQKFEAEQRASMLRHRIAAGGQIIAKGADRIATIAGYRMPGKAASAQLIQFDMAGIAVSAGSACSSGTLKTSKVLTAMGLDEDAANEVIRVSFGPETGRADVYRFLETWQRIRG